MQPLLKKLDGERSAKGPKPSYSAEELEQAVLFQKLAGLRTYAEARTLLASDRHEETRRLLGFDKPRKRYGRGLTLVRSMDGVPSEATVWRHLQRFGLDRHIAAYKKLFERLVKDHLQDPAMREEARVLNIDGSTMRSHYTSFDRFSKKTGKLIRPATLHGGGYMPRTETNFGKAGHGFNLVTAVTATGLPLAYRVTPLVKTGYGESATALKIFEEEWKRAVAPYLHQDKLGILTADSAYSSRPLRAAIREIGYVENCHKVSHADRARSRRHAGKHDRIVFEIEDYPNWRANGHRELFCKCGKGKTARRVSMNNGRAVVRTEGSCRKCGSIMVTSGKWRKAANPRRFVRILKGEEDRADWTFGNPFTFHDELAEQFGSARFGHHEGFHGHLVTRFSLLKGKAWYRRREQAELDVLMTFSIMHALAMEQRRRAGVIALKGGPGTTKTRAARGRAGKGRAAATGPPQAA
jgi:hypothetical protein